MKNIIVNFFAAVFISGCIHSTAIPDKVKSSAPGFGSSKERPLGTPFILPHGITIVGKPHWDFDCMEEAKRNKRVYGNGTMVHFCIQFRNSTNSPITIIMPAGLTFISETDRSQNGVLIQLITIEIPPQIEAYYHILNNCLNNDREPTDYNVAFEPNPIISEHEGLKELTDLLAVKKVNTEDYNGEPTPLEFHVPIQTAVDEIAAIGEMSETSREAISQLPDK